MTDYMKEPLGDILNYISAKKVVDTADVEGIRQRLYANGDIDREKADFLFAINDAVSGNDNAPEWAALFVEALTDHVLKDKTTAGEVDDIEAAYLIQKINNDGQVDPVEVALLSNIMAQAKVVCLRFRKFAMAWTRKWHRMNI